MKGSLLATIFCGAFWATSGCGSKTGLLVPDVHVPVDVPCPPSTVAGDPFGSVRAFASGSSFPPGRYRIRYVDGCMKYGGDQGWTVNAYPASVASDQWWLVDASRRLIVQLPGNVGFVPGAGGFTNFDDCVAASRALPPVEIDFDGGQLAVFLRDRPYDDNVAGVNGQNPRWSIECVEH